MFMIHQMSYYLGKTYQAEKDIYSSWHALKIIDQFASELLLLSTDERRTCRIYGNFSELYIYRDFTFRPCGKETRMRSDKNLPVPPQLAFRRGAWERMIKGIAVLAIAIISSFLWVPWLATCSVYHFQRTKQTLREGWISGRISELKAQYNAGQHNGGRQVVNIKGIIEPQPQLPFDLLLQEKLLS